MNLDFTKFDLEAERYMRKAISLLKQSYGNEQRKFSNKPSWLHSLEVYKVLENYTNDTDLLIAALLHDFIEDFDAEEMQKKLEEQFPLRPINIVKILTKPKVKDICRNERNIRYWKSISENPDARLVKLADTLVNISEEDDSKEFLFRYLNEKSVSFLLLDNGCSLSDAVKQKLTERISGLVD